MCVSIDRITAKTGFTLIEMSIVLVIIGLIVGGILTGQDLINAAAVRAQISQIEKYNTAVRTFQGKYGGLPGDLSMASASQFGFQSSAPCNGTTGERDGNGYIDGYYSGQYVVEYGEATLFWADLSQASLIEGSFPNGGATFSASICGGVGTALSTTSGSSYVGTFFPTAKIGQSNFVYVYDGSHASDGNTGGIGDNWFGIASITSVPLNGNMVTATAMSVLQAYNIDRKIDDGSPILGAVQAVYLNGEFVQRVSPGATDSPATCWNWTANAYSIAVNGGNGLNCALSFKIL